MMVVKNEESKREIFVDETKIMAVEDSLIRKGSVEVLFQDNPGVINNGQFFDGFKASDFEEAYKKRFDYLCVKQEKEFIMNSINTYRAYYYMDGHPEKCFSETFDCDSEDEAFSYIDEMENENKTVFELQQQITTFKTILERK